MNERNQAVVVISPYRATNRRSRQCHATHAGRLCLALARAGNAVFAPHLFCPAFLDEDVPADRELGIAIGKEWIARADRIAVWDAWGISSGMEHEIAWAELINDLQEIENAAGDLRFTSPQIKIHYFTKGEVPEWKDWNEKGELKGE